MDAVRFNQNGVGDEFQVEVPPFNTEPNSIDAEYRTDYQELGFDLNEPYVSPESSQQAEPKLVINEPYVSPESSRGAEPKLLIDLNKPYDSPESSGQAKPRLLIDLNEPYVSPESENQTLDQQDIDQSLPSTSATEVKPESEPEPIVNLRRHSTRSRRPTTRALEAIAHGYLTANRKRKRGAGSSHGEMAS